MKRNDLAWGVSTILCKRRLVRVTGRILASGAVVKAWRAQPMQARHGLFIGIRTLRNGERSQDEEGYRFTPKGEPVRALLVVFGPGERPVLVPFDEGQRNLFEAAEAAP